MYILRANFTTFDINHTGVIHKAVISKVNESIQRDLNYK